LGNMVPINSDTQKRGRSAKQAKGEAIQVSPLSKQASLFGIFLSFLKIGAFTFGGGWAMVPLIRKQLVERKRWLEESEFIDILALAQSGPGPIAVNVSVLCGFKMRKLPGAVIATLGAGLPSFLIILIIASLFLRIKNSTVVEAIFKGMRPAIFGLLISAVWQVGKKSIKSGKDIGFAVIGVILILVLKLSPILVILLSAISGVILGASLRRRQRLSEMKDK